jgi:cysteine synthase A
MMTISSNNRLRELAEEYKYKYEFVNEQSTIYPIFTKAFNGRDMIFVGSKVENPANVEIQRLTGEEILKDAGRKIDGFCSGIGTGGTITGIGQTLRKANPDVEIWAVEPEHAAILSGGSVGTHLQMGIGDGLIPGILDQDIYDEICIVKDEQAIKTSKQLASLEGIMCGISSGTNVCAALRLAKKLGPGKTVVTVLPDTAERYFSTPLFREVKYW